MLSYFYFECKNYTTFKSLKYSDLQMLEFKGFYKHSHNLLSNRLVLLILIGLPFLFRQNIYRSLVMYNVSRERVVDTQIDAFFERYILKHPDVFDRKFDDIDKIIHVSLKLTADALSYNGDLTLKSDPLSTIRLGETNSEGYASFFNAVCSYLLRRYHFSDDYSCQQYIAERTQGGRNLTEVFQSPYGGESPFNKNRDIVAVVNRSGKQVFVDPVIYDQFSIVEISVVGVYSGTTVQSGISPFPRKKRVLFRNL